MRNKVLAVIGTGFSMTERRFNIENTWGQDIDHIYFSDHEEHNIIKVTDETEYTFGELKQVNIINVMPDYYLDNYKWIFFADDDTFLNTKLFYSKLDEFPTDKITGYIYSCWPVMPDLKYLSGGAGFLMTTEMLKSMKGKVKYLKTGFGDVTLGLYYKENNISLNHNNLFIPERPEHFNFKIQLHDVNKYLTVHRIKEFEEMLYLYELCK
jgi:hypothetical protein